MTLDYFLNILQGTLTPEDSIFIVTTNHYEQLDPAFTRDGRFDVKIQLDLCDHHQIQEIFRDFIGRPIDPDVLSQIPEYQYSPAKLIFHLKEYILGDANALPDAVILESFMEK
jgi:SpoVK/Ycf46/Vps4 family AAA+-type ATPase